MMTKATGATESQDKEWSCPDGQLESAKPETIATPKSQKKQDIAAGLSAERTNAGRKPLFRT